jgi:hypothetical protein
MLFQVECWEGVFRKLWSSGNQTKAISCLKTVDVTRYPYEPLELFYVFMFVFCPLYLTRKQSEILPYTNRNNVIPGYIFNLRYF